MQRRPELMAERGALQAGVGVPQFSAGRERLRQGLPGVVVDDPAQQMTRIDTDASERIKRALIEGLPLLGAETWNPQQIAQATGAYADENRLADVVAGRLDPERLRVGQMAARGQNRYGVQGDEMIDQFKGFGGQTRQGESKIIENQAQAARARQGANLDRMTIKETVDEQGNPILYRVPIQGKEGPIEGPAPRTRRKAEDLEIEREYIDTYGRDPLMRERGSPSQIEFKNAAKRFAGDAQMKDTERGAWVPGKGFEIYRNGTLVGHYK
jgi:hypothetical protein